MPIVLKHWLIVICRAPPLLLRSTGWLVKKYRRGAFWEYVAIYVGSPQIITKHINPAGGLIRAIKRHLQGVWVAVKDLKLSYYIGEPYYLLYIPIMVTLNPKPYIPIMVT